ncbi:arabinan endo-1,5-alpha-L-arabinosidase [Roseateles sp. YR242]|uniref:arabinan endo-1,5-alpha-L-arabinosidase n=1 Tax=Roseateles sp. YR242 TaxID=1855305 RepID=UPI0015A6D057|nr:arabinan endo-1,5-alpha-L-arabinosidase [Roseateles sp. YR242]
MAIAKVTTVLAAGLLAAACAPVGPASVPSPASPASAASPVETNPGAHDPSLIVVDGQFHVFTTGRGVQHLRSSDGQHWERLAPVFDQAPAWWADAVPAHRGLDVWAPKVFEHKGRFWLMYSISTFGKNRSAIGLASSTALQGQPWRDDGLVQASVETDDFNAIDPDVLADTDGRLWLSYGSFWGGLRVVELDPQSLRPRGETRFMARRKGGIEAPTLWRRGEWVYLFASFDFCCRGLNSTYNIRVGRARSPQGPFVDQAGVDMMNGGGTVVEQGAGRWIGPGHQDVVGRWIVRHAYDAQDGGRPKLRLDELRWTEDGWPML